MQETGMSCAGHLPHLRSPEFVPVGRPPTIVHARLVLPILAICLLHGVLCLWFHYDRAWLADELGSYLAFRETYRHLLTHFGDWQTMNFYLAALKAIHDSKSDANWLLVLPGILCGIWLVWLVAALALRLGAARCAAVVAALLAAVNPYVVLYSITIRSYIFLATFSAAMMLFLFDWRRTGRWREASLCGISGALALVAHLNATYTYIAVGTLALCWTVARARERDPGWPVSIGRLTASVGLPAALVGLAYVPQLPDILRFRAMWSDTPPIPLTFLPTMFSLFFGNGYLMLPTLLVLLYAAWRACRDDRDSQWMLLAFGVVVASISLGGVSHYPWAYARFLFASLPWLVLLIADGVGTIIGQSGRRRFVGTVTVAILSVCSLVALSRERRDEHAHPWHRIAAHVRGEMTTDDRCLVIGRPIYSTAMQVYGVPCSDKATAALTGLWPDKLLRVLLVVGPRGFTPKFPTREFGDVRVMAVAGTPQAIASQLIKEMIAGANGHVTPELADVYREVGSLLRWAGKTDAATTYDLLQRECWLRDDRFRNQPPQFLSSRF
jgi:uncharacterized membrane protein